MPRDVTEEPGPSRPKLRTVRRARNSKHDVPCGPDCLVYPRGKKDYTPDGLMGEVARYLELDLKTRQASDRTWVERKGGKRRHKGGRHRHCQRPNRFHPAGDEAEAAQDGDASQNVEAAQDAEVVQADVGDQEVPALVEGRVYPALPPPGEMRPADQVALAWRRRDEQEREATREEARVLEEAQQEEEPRQDQRLAIEGRPANEGDGLRGIRRLMTFRVTRRPPEAADEGKAVVREPRGFRRIFHVHRRPAPAP
ncbi:hypothetical protein CPLU01_02590 [Colletotrichum plurivorum]|uniref:Uncharacterized protein n=1 Tax=Colletotrichum plurivorum TaxID=2175906 RepID=A0A8H6KV70_9PEZI|nr:hypothetical protein CPLU01_02590 [Colletotrichum plurivorum]